MATPAYSLNLDEFRRYAREGNLIPLYREILADYETPVSAFAKIDHGPTAYLLESIEGGRSGQDIRFSAAARRSSFTKTGAISWSCGARKRPASRAGETPLSG